MIDTKIGEYIRAGKVKEESLDFLQVDGLIREAVVDLNEARLTQEVGAHRATFFLSYMAMLRSGRALLRLKGFKPVNKSKHKTIVELTIAIMGKKHRDITNHIEHALHKQMDLVHKGGCLLTEIEAHDTFHYALLLMRAVIRMVKSEYPDFHVEF